MFLDDVSGGKQVIRAAALCFTDRGEENARRVPGLTVFRYGKHFERTPDLLAGLVNGENRAAAIIFFSAAGIAVRSMAPFIVSKTTDPAVIVVNDAADYVIPVLSGHIGRANDIARELARILGAEAVITTATDHIPGIEAVDVWAEREGWRIASMKDAKAVTAAMAAGVKTVRAMESPGVLKWKTIGTEEKKAASVDLYPKPLTIGIGCKKNTPPGQVYAAVSHALEILKKDSGQVFRICSIDLKQSENGIIRTAMKLRVPFVVFTADQLNAAEGDFTSSEFVRKITGTDNVCERAAIAGCGAAGGRLVVPKTAADGVTVAVAERNIKWNYTS